MEKLGLLSLLLLFAKVIALVTTQSESRIFLFHSYSEIIGNKALNISSQKLLNFFSETSDGNMLKIAGDFDNKELNLSFNVDTSSYRLIRLSFSRLDPNNGCGVLSMIKYYKIALITDDAQSAILLYGCDMNSMENIRIVFIESLSFKVLQVDIDNLAIAPVLALPKPRDRMKSGRFYGFCTCMKRREIRRSAEKESKTFDVFCYGLLGTAFLVFVIWKIHSTLSKEEKYLPYLP